MCIEDRCNINDPQVSKTLFMKEYQDDILQIQSFISTGWKACAT